MPGGMQLLPFDHGFPFLILVLLRRGPAQEEEDGQRQHFANEHINCLKLGKRYLKVGMEIFLVIGSLKNIGGVLELVDWVSSKILITWIAPIIIMAGIQNFPEWKSEILFVSVGSIIIIAFE